MDIIKEWAPIVILFFILILNYYSTRKRPREEQKEESIRWRTNIDRDQEAFKEFIDDTKQTLQNLQNQITIIFDILSKRSVADRSSPIILTQYGKEIAKNVNASENTEDFVGSYFLELIDQQKSELRSDKGTDILPHEIQEKCLSYFMNEYSPLPKVNELFQQCVFKEGVLMGQIHIVLAITARDTLFDYLGIILEEN